jgi:acetyltransferase
MQTAAAELVIRPLRSGERDLVVEVFEGLSERSRRLRFLGPKPDLPPRDLDRLVDVESPRHRAFVAIDPDSGRAIGVARYVRDASESAAAEVAFAVVDEFHGRGVGSQLAGALRHQARADRVETLHGTIAPQNTAAIALIGRSETTSSSGSIVGSSRSR